MTDFQLGLVLIGGIAIAAVLIYNRVQERRTRRQAQRHFSSQHADSLLEGARRDPPLAAEPVRHPLEVAAALAEPYLPDEALDYVIEIAFAAPVSGASWAEAWQALARRLKQRVVLAAAGDGADWEAVESRPARAWPRYRAGMQLVSRAGSASEADILEFRTAVEGIAAMLAGTVQPTPTDARHAITCARELDRFCAQSDIQLAFHLVAPEATRFPAGEIRRAARANELEETANGFRKCDANGQEWFSISAPAEPESERLTFTLDVPRTDNVRGAYMAMVAAAQRIRSALGGALVDDNDAPLDERALEAIWHSVEPIIRSLEERGAAPGSRLALRLFS